VTTTAMRVARHRRGLWAGLAISASVHVAVLTGVYVPGVGPTEDDGRDAATRVDDFDALELVTLREPAPVDLTSVRPSDATNSAGSASAPTPEAPGRPSLSEMLAHLSPASVAATTPETGRPVVTFRDLEPVAQTDAMLAVLALGGGLQNGEEDEGGGWSALLGGIAAALSGGGQCPTPGGVGPMILR
jgi:hypothetical protein